MKPVGIAAACGAGLVGAFVWGAIAYFTGYEVGYVAWGIGLLVGFAVVATKSGGDPAAGSVAVLITACSILGGKYMAFSWSVGDSGDEAIRSIYDEQVTDARDLAALEAGEDLREYLASHGYSESKKAAGVTQSEIEEFQSESEAFLRRIHAESMTFAAWKETEEGESIVASIDAAIAATVKFGDMFGLFDIVFMLLGVATAYKFASRAPDTVVA